MTGYRKFPVYVPQKDGRDDWTKINLTMGELGFTGSELDKILIEDYNIYTELFTGTVNGFKRIGNNKEDYNCWQML